MRTSTTYYAAAGRRRGERRTVVGLLLAIVAVTVALAILVGPLIGGGMASGGGRAGDGADAVIPDGASIAATAVDHPAIARLEPALRSALADATADAAREGVELRVTSGWRSRAHQQRLYDDAIARYGDSEQARRLVASPDRSAHVRGAAVDIGPTDAAYWMQRFGARFGLCQTFANEVWHYELAVEPGGRCPVPAPDASGA